MREEVERVERVERAFEHPSAEQREVITLAHVTELSRAEIARQMGSREVTVSVLLLRSLARRAEVSGSNRESRSDPDWRGFSAKFDSAQIRGRVAEPEPLQGRIVMLRALLRNR